MPYLASWSACEHRALPRAGPGAVSPRSGRGGAMAGIPSVSV